METSQPLATESFSHSWLLNVKPAFDGLDEPLRASMDSSDETSSKEMDDKTVKLKRLLEEAKSFNFDTPIPQSPVALVHADELFSNGLIKPIYVNPSKIEAFSTSNPIPALPVNSLPPKYAAPAVSIQCNFFGTWRKPSKRILQKCFGLFRPLGQKVGGSRKCIRVDDIDRREWEVRSWSNSPKVSPRLSTAYSVDDWYDCESPINEAVLHCKRSIEK